jgi:hypothetical protein
VAIDANKEMGEGSRNGRFFSENGMCVHDCEVLNVEIQSDIEDLFTEHQYEMVQKNLELIDAEKRVALNAALMEAEQKEHDLRSQKLINAMARERKETLERMAIQEEVQRQKEKSAELEMEAEIARRKASTQAEKDLQELLNAISEAERSRKEADFQNQLAHKEQLAAIEKAKQEAYAETVAKIMSAVSEDLAAAMTSKANADMVETVSKAMSPVAMAKGDSVANVVNTLLRGTSLEGVLKDFGTNKE